MLISIVLKLLNNLISTLSQQNINRVQNENFVHIFFPHERLKDFKIFRRVKNLLKNYQ